MCWVSFGGPHEPWDAPDPYASMYNPPDMPKPIASTHGIQCRPEATWTECAAAPEMTPDETASMRANYAGNVSLIDDQIGEILKTIEAKGELAEGELSHQQFAKSLCPVFEYRAAEPRDYVISEIHGEVMYMDHKWKLMLDADGRPCLLFDLKNDPDEQNNLVDDASTAKTVVELCIWIQEHLIRTQVQL